MPEEGFAFGTGSPCGRPVEGSDASPHPEQEDARQGKQELQAVVDPPAGAADLLAWGMTRLQEPAEAKPAPEKGQPTREVPQQEEGEAQAGPAASAVRGVDGVHVEEDGIPVVEPVMQGDCDEALLEVTARVPSNPSLGLRCNTTEGVRLISLCVRHRRNSMRNGRNSLSRP